MTIAADSAAGELPLTSTAAAVVLDTNVVLDWLLFGEPSVSTLAEAVMQRRVRWLATTAMRDELDSVLSRGLAARRGAEVASVLAGWDRFATIVPGAVAHPLRCTDPDDQKFVDLALGTGARWLVSRDRALLKLARRATAAGTLIVTPQRWQRV